MTKKRKTKKRKKLDSRFRGNDKKKKNKKAKRENYGHTEF